MAVNIPIPTSRIIQDSRSNAVPLHHLKKVMIEDTSNQLPQIDLGALSEWMWKEDQDQETQRAGF